MQDQILLAPEVFEERRLGDLGGGGHVGHRDVVVAVPEEEEIAAAERASWVRCRFRSRSPGPSVM
ncbi:hypothetical protein GCM10027615_41150 [Plantactinospora veratri]